MFAYVSAIQDISLSPVLMSGAGTSMPGPVEQRQEGKERERERGEESDITMCLKGPQDVKTAASMQTESN